MIHDREDGQEESEYHFSDDQANYEIEPDEVKAASPAVAAPRARGDNPYRKPVIGVLIAIFLVFLVYKILIPSPPSAPTTDFAQNATKPTASTAIVPVTTQKPVIKTASVSESAPVTPPTPAASSAEANVPTMASQPSSAPPLATVPQPPAAVANGPAETQAPPAAPTPASLTLETAKPTLTLPSVDLTPRPASPSADNLLTSATTASPAALEKLIALQEENAKLVNQLQSEYAQKIASFESQDSAVQGKLQDLSMRIASIETSLVRLGKAIQDLKKNRSEMAGSNDNGAAMAQPVAARPIEARMIYTVQAIIPGRAWLKSDAGDTITVAEGDVLKNYGRVTKIDPYDGIVEIDTGGKVISLSYGAANG